MNIFENPELAASYDEYYHTDFGQQVDRIEKEIIDSLLENLPKERMLELGCGTGHWTSFFADKGFEVMGVDNSEAMLSVARSKRIDAEFLLADAHDLPFPDESIRVISSITMMEFVDDPESVIGEIFRVLKNGSWLILGCLNADSILGKNKDEDEVFKNTRMLKPGELKTRFHQFDILRLEKGVYLSSEFKILDQMDDTRNTEPVFMGVLLKKNQ